MAPMTASTAVAVAIVSLLLRFMTDPFFNQNFHVGSWIGPQHITPEFLILRGVLSSPGPFFHPTRIRRAIVLSVKDLLMSIIWYSSPAQHCLTDYDRRNRWLLDCLLKNRKLYIIRRCKEYRGIQLRSARCCS